MLQWCVLAGWLGGGWRGVVQEACAVGDGLRIGGLIFREATHAWRRAWHACAGASSPELPELLRRSHPVDELGAQLALPLSSVRVGQWTQWVEWLVLVRLS
jgi:hypothetical protein